MKPESSVQLAEFGELGAFSEAIEHADMRVTATALPKRQHWWVRTLHLPNGIVLQDASEGGANFLEGVTEPDGFVLWGILNDAPSTCVGTRFDQQSLFILPPNTEFSITCESGQDWMDIFVPNELVAMTIGEDAMHETSRLGAQVANISTNDLIKLRSLNSGMLDNASREQHIADESASVATFSEALLPVFTRQLNPVGNAPKHKDGRPSTLDPQMMRDLVDRIEAELSEPVTLAVLVAMTGVSERTLRNGFNKYFGVSPQQYILLRRLYRANSLLRKAKHDETKVSEVAAELGMWDLGRFAMRYRALFGERPSETLHN